MRINAQGQYQAPSHSGWRPLARLLKPGDEPKAQPVRCFRTPRAQLACTLLGYRAAHAQTPWLLLTDLPPACVHASWYGMRSWIEGGFKDLKRGGWHGEQTKMTAPERAERLWLAMAVATLWVLSVGGAAKAQRTAVAMPRPSPRVLSCFAQGLNLIHVARDQHAPLPLGGFTPDLAWPMLNLKNAPPKNLPL